MTRGKRSQWRQSELDGAMAVLTTDTTMWSDYVTAFEGAVNSKYAVTDQEVCLLVNLQK